jgi:hypothetical protein
LNTMCDPTSESTITTGVLTRRRDMTIHQIRKIWTMRAREAPGGPAASSTGSVAFVDCGSGRMGR